MAHWLDEYPALRIMPKTIAAEDYNRIRLGLLREQTPWHVPLTQFRCMHFILDHSTWVCVNDCQNDIPLLAWTNFKRQDSSTLDTPVKCELRLYHMHAGLVMGSTLEALAATVGNHLDRQPQTNYPVSKISQ